MWLSRDPIAEAGGINLTSFGDGDAINNYDPYGLFIFDRKESTGQRRAVGIAEAGDTPEIVAALAGLDPNEIFGPKGWLRDEFGNPVNAIKPSVKYTVPNTVAITIGNIHSARIRDQVSAPIANYLSVKQHYSDLGYYIDDADVPNIDKSKNKHVWNTESLRKGYTLAQINELIGSADVAVWAHFGHGKVVKQLKRGGFWSISPMKVSEWKFGGLNLTNEKTGWIIKNSEVAKHFGKAGDPDILGGTYGGHYAGAFKPNHKLQTIVLYSCDAGRAAAQWGGLLAPAGVLYADPVPVKVYPTWKKWNALQQWHSDGAKINP